MFVRIIQHEMPMSECIPVQGYRWELWRTVTFGHSEILPTGILTSCTRTDT